MVNYIINDVTTAPVSTEDGDMVLIQANGSLFTEYSTAIEGSMHGISVAGTLGAYSSTIDHRGDYVAINVLATGWVASGHYAIDLETSNYVRITNAGTIDGSRTAIRYTNPDMNAEPTVSPTEFSLTNSCLLYTSPSPRD